MSLENIGRRNLLARGAGVGLAVTAGLAMTVVPVAAQDSATPAAGGESDIDKLKADVRAAYDKTKGDLETLGSDVSDDTRDAFDELQAGFDAIGTELSRAEEIPNDSVRQVKRAYRDVQHALEELDDKVDRVLHLPLHLHDQVAGRSADAKDQVDDAVKDTWHGVREALHSVHRAADHVIDAV
jgi:enamine deaminase RidA (YjgF/YER057c/UK114 family)